MFYSIYAFTGILEYFYDLMRDINRIEKYNFTIVLKKGIFLGMELGVLFLMFSYNSTMAFVIISIQIMLYRAYTLCYYTSFTGQKPNRKVVFIYMLIGPTFAICKLSGRYLKKLCLLLIVFGFLIIIIKCYGSR